MMTMNLAQALTGSLGKTRHILVCGLIGSWIGQVGEISKILLKMLFLLCKLISIAIMETLGKRKIISTTFSQVPACLLISKFWLDDILGEPLIFMESDALEPFLIAQHFPGLFWGMAIGYGLHCLALIVCLTYLIRSKLYIYAKCQQSSFFFQLGGMRRGGTEEKQEVRGRRRGDSVIAELKDSNMWKNIPICGISLKG